MNTSIPSNTNSNKTIMKKQYIRNKNQLIATLLALGNFAAFFAVSISNLILGVGSLTINITSTVVVGFLFLSITSYTIIKQVLSSSSATKGAAIDFTVNVLLLVASSVIGIALSIKTEYPYLSIAMFLIAGIIQVTYLFGLFYNRKEDKQKQKQTVLSIQE